MREACGARRSRQPSRRPGALIRPPGAQNTVNASPGEEPLHAAALYGHVDAACTLLELGASTSVTDKVRAAQLPCAARPPRAQPAARLGRGARALGPRAAPLGCIWGG